MHERVRWCVCVCSALQQISKCCQRENEQRMANVVIRWNREVKFNDDDDWNALLLISTNFWIQTGVSCTQFIVNFTSQQSGKRVKRNYQQFVSRNSCVSWSLSFLKIIEKISFEWRSEAMNSRRYQMSQNTIIDFAEFFGLLPANSCRVAATKVTAMFVRLYLCGWKLW